MPLAVGVAGSLSRDVFLRLLLLAPKMRLPPLRVSELALEAADALCPKFTWLGLNTTLALSFCTASSSASSIAQWFFTLLNFGQVALSPQSIACTINVGVGFDSMRGKSAYDISGRMVMSPEYF